MRTPYAGAATSWAEQATLAYEPLARHLLARAPVQRRGLRALDAGAGSGVVSEALREAGAEVVAADLEPDMARHAAASGPALAADVTALPFRAGVFDLAVGAYVVNHLLRPAAGLAELRRVTRPGGSVLVAVFSATQSTSKAAVDEVAAGFGFVRPEWYDELQRRVAAIGSTAAMERALTDAGFTSFLVSEEAVDVGLREPDLVVRYRTGMPHLREFLTGLSPDRRAAFLNEAAAAVRRTGEEFAPVVIEAAATA